ncbi:hypothetical protein RAB80_011768 [Fusarium oxysporum f. sp. vasinfectum]|nr:hypothetical protein RAB80_011768 [Fusarium oxysporum f. sp. vasinfectum]KAK2929017.1 hypothetical protein FoTM2_011881 [Fusarium oxysporum f. sp. vasinfectum]
MEAIGSGNAFNVTPEETKRHTRKLLTNPYWGRLWVAQEILLAKQITLLCGPRQLSWALWSDFWPPLIADVHVPYLFALGKLFYGGASNDDFKASSAAQTFIRLRRNSNILHLLPLWNHLTSFSNSKCQEPRDKVFGLLGFVGDKGQIEVDYVKPVVEIYVDAINLSLDTTPRIRFSGGIDPEFYAEMLYLGVAMGLLTTGEQVVSVVNYFGRELGRLLTPYGINKALGVEPTGISEFAGKCLGHLHRLHGVLAEGDIATILKSVGTLQGKLR